MRVSGNSGFTLVAARLILLLERHMSLQQMMWTTNRYNVVDRIIKDEIWYWNCLKLSNTTLNRIRCKLLVFDQRQ